MVKTLAICNGMLAVALVLLAVAFHLVDGQRLAANHRYETETVCDNAVASSNFKNCYAVEAAYNTEFLCNNNESNCWVEVK